MTANKLYEQFKRIYQSVDPNLATEHTKRREQEIYNSATNEAGYKQASMSALMALKKRPIVTDIKDIETMRGSSGLDAESAGKQLLQAVEKWILKDSELKQMGYPLDDILEHEGGSIETAVGTTQTCDRCKSQFTVKDILNAADLEACTYHHGRMRQTMNHGAITALRHLSALTCYQQVKGEGYTPAVMNHTVARGVLQVRMFTKGYTTAGMELLRLTAVDDRLNTIIDERVLPSHMILDLNTRYSGISTLEGTKHDLDSIRKELFKYVDADTIIVGHGLENDMIALRIVHHKIIDTAALFPHPNGLPYRYSLRVLATKYLSKFIQDSSDGHDSFEDSKTCIELLEAHIKRNK
ncbi:RNA exonuclease 3 [Apophysomyces ossiformis]|uniref:RNA exonuclease 3 n=1 Tax=Apophysomyces ossiformis TaxID=679940 RepID=A0A8H7BVE9_9FUNG|nr:RNA exonuclease 3 [Apophysomyces ossiformis]